MWDRLFFSTALVANISTAAICLLYTGGALLLFPLMICIHIILFCINQAAGKTWCRLIGLGIIHIIITFCVHQQWAWLYFKYICDDLEGRAIALGGCLVGVIWTVILLIASMVIFQHKSKTGVRSTI